MKLVFVLFLLMFYGLAKIYGKSVAASDSTAIIALKDAPKRPNMLKKSVIPITLLGIGLIANNSTFEKKLQQDIRSMVGNDYQFRIDDYVQYAPIAEMYVLDLSGVKARNHWFDQLKFILFSNLLSAAITHTLKDITGKTRPNGASFSFPSGHTTLALTNATVLFHEFRDSSPLAAYSGYAFAATTGIFRMINNRHWFSDVMVGGGIGILSAILVYHFEPFKDFNPFKHTKSVILMPAFSDGSCSLYFSYRF